jgi:hypothetical protein
LIAIFDRIRQRFQQQRGRRLPDLIPAPTILPSISEAVEAAVASRLGCAVTHIGNEQVEQEKTATARRKLSRKYMRHVLRAGAPVNRDVVVFTKTGPSVASDNVERYLSEVSLPEFRVPLFYGRTATEEGDVGIWEYVSGERPGLLTLSREDLRRVVCAIAAINTLTADVVRHVPDLQVGTKFVEPIADRLRAALVADETMLQREPYLQDALDRFAALEAGALARLASIGNRFFSHQDISAGNALLTPAPNPVLIIDWESAGIAAPGASLRRFVSPDMETRADVAQHYVDYLQANGTSVDVDDVLFVMGAASVFASLHAGVSHLEGAPLFARKLIRSTLTRVPDYLCCSARGRAVVSRKQMRTETIGLGL